MALPVVRTRLRQLLNLYEAGLKIVLRHRFITLMVMFGTIALTGYLYVVIPKGFFPQQDTGLIIGLSEAAQDISFQGMAQRKTFRMTCRFINHAGAAQLSPTSRNARPHRRFFLATAYDLLMERTYQALLTTRSYQLKPPSTCIES